MTLTSLTLLSSANRVDAGVMLGTVSVVAIDSSNAQHGATAVHGFLVGNDTGAGDPLLTLLNVGTSTGIEATLVGPPQQAIEISETGMFSTSNKTGDAFVDLIDGSPVLRAPNTPWVFQGKSGESSTPFTTNPKATDGNLVLITPLSGNMVVSLKTSTQYAVFAFAGLSSVVSFTFSGLSQDLSHASLYTSNPAPITGPPGAVPEPASLAIFGFGALGLGLGQVRRRRKVVATTV